MWSFLKKILPLKKEKIHCLLNPFFPTLYSYSSCSWSDDKEWISQNVPGRVESWLKSGKSVSSLSSKVNEVIKPNY